MNTESDFPVTALASAPATLLLAYAPVSGEPAPASELTYRATYTPEMSESLILDDSLYAHVSARWT